MDHLKGSGIGASFLGQFGPKAEHEREATASSELELKIIANVYTEILKQRNFQILHSENSYQSAWHLFVVRVSNREVIQEHFKTLGVETGIHYPIPLHLQPALKEQFSNMNLAVTETLADEIISIPIHPHLTDKEVLLIANEFIKVAEWDAS